MNKKTKEPTLLELLREKTKGFNDALPVTDHKKRIITDKATVLGFLRGGTKDNRGRTFFDIIHCSDEQMEKCHDQIQWIFPLHETSKFAIVYPILTKEMVDEAMVDDQIIYNMIIAQDRMQEFLGIGEYSNEKKQKQWCQNKNHNLLRITRVIRSLRFFGLELEANNFFRKAYAVGKKFGLDQSTFLFWEKALVDDVWKSLR